MAEYNQLLTNILFFLELIFAAMVVFMLCCASKFVQTLEEKIKQGTGETLERIVEVRQEVHTLNKYLSFVQTFKKYSVIKSAALNVLDIINLLLLFTPGTSLLKIRKFLSLQVLKTIFSMMKA